MQQIEPGWYPDPFDWPGTDRYWDGAAWTPSVRDTAGTALPWDRPSVAVPPPPGTDRPADDAAAPPVGAALLAADPVPAPPAPVAPSEPALAEPAPPEAVAGAAAPVAAGAADPVDPAAAGGPATAGAPPAGAPHAANPPVADPVEPATAGGGPATAAAPPVAAPPAAPRPASPSRRRRRRQVAALAVVAAGGLAAAAAVGVSSGPAKPAAATRPRPATPTTQPGSVVVPRHKPSAHPQRHRGLPNRLPTLPGPARVGTITTGVNPPWHAGCPIGSLRVTVVLTDRLVQGTTWFLEVTGSARSTEPAALDLKAAEISLRVGRKATGLAVPIRFTHGTVLAASGRQGFAGRVMIEGRIPPKIEAVPQSWRWAAPALASCPLPS